MRDDIELMSSLEEKTLSDLGPARRCDLFLLREKIDRDLVERPGDSALPNGPELYELAAPIVTDPMTTAPAVFGLNCAIGNPSGPNTFTNR